MKHFITLEDMDDGSIHIQALKQGSMEELAQDQAGIHTPAGLLAAFLIERAITDTVAEKSEKTAKSHIHTADVGSKH